MVYLILYIKKIFIMKFFVFICLLALLSCNTQSHKDYLYELKFADESISFPLSTSTTTYIKSLSIFTDSLGKKYLAFMSNDEPEIYLYDIHKANLVKTIRFHKEGPDGVGPKAGGFFMAGFNEIYLPSLYVPEISKIDSAGHKLGVLRFGDSPQSFPFITTRSVIGLPMLEIDNSLYCPQLVNPRLGDKQKTDSPVAMRIDLGTLDTDASDFCYPSFLCKESHVPSLGIESKASYCYNGKEFIYSFAFDENLYVLSTDFKLIKKVNASSKYIDGISIPDNVPTQMDLGIKMMCEIPYYGDIIYDEYRQLYYRIAYPKDSLKEGESLSDMMQSGRTRFSIIILDKDLNVVGETMFPENLYRSNLYYIEKDGLYISSNHYKNSHYNEDNLSFDRFIVTEN